MKILHAILLEARTRWSLPQSPRLVRGADRGCRISFTILSGASFRQKNIARAQVSFQLFRRVCIVFLRTSQRRSCGQCIFPRLWLPPRELLSKPPATGSFWRPHSNFVRNVACIRNFMGANLTHDSAPWRDGLLSMGPHFLSAWFSGIVGSKLRYVRITRDYIPIARPVGEPIFDFFPKAEGMFAPPVCDEAEDGNHHSPSDDLINPDGTMNDSFLGNPDITDGQMIGSVWKDSSDPRVFVYESDYRTVLALCTQGLGLSHRSCFGTIRVFCESLRQYCERRFHTY